MPTQRGYTGQLLDPSGLHYYHARYYDGSIGQFISADTVQGPNRYAYVGGNPETLTDPSGHSIDCTISGDPACGLSGLLTGGGGASTGSGALEWLGGALDWLGASLEEAGAAFLDLGAGDLALPILLGALIWQMATPQPLSTAGSMTTPANSWSAASGTAPAPPLPPQPGITATGGITGTATSGGMPIASPLPTTLSTPIQAPLPTAMVNPGISLNLPNWVMSSNGKSIRYVSEKYLEKILKELYGTDPHAVKIDILGRRAKIASWDFYVDSNGEL